MKQLDPKAVWLFFFSYILRSFLFVIFIIFWFFWIFISEFETTESYINDASFWPFVFTLIYFILCFIWAKLNYHFYRYELTDAGFRKELGIINKKYVTIPYDRIQNVDIYRGILDRLLGLSDLNIQTAGLSAAVGRHGNSSEGRLPAVSREDAEKLRDELIERARQTKNQGL